MAQSLILVLNRNSNRCVFLRKIKSATKCENVSFPVKRLFDAGSIFLPNVEHTHSNPNFSVPPIVFRNPKNQNFLRFAHPAEAT